MDLDTKFVSELDGHTHLRSQLAGNSVEKVDYKTSTAQPGYGLRENPKKTWRAEDLKTHPLINEQQERFCKQCGKGFRSMKALCGHMACHSEKDRFLKDDDSWTSERVERDDENRKRPQRAAIMKRDKGLVKSMYVSEIDFEQEEVAMCLIMLSKDYRDCVGVGSNQESSDSVVLETKSSSIDTKIGRLRDRDCVYDSVEAKKFGKGKLKSSVYEETMDGYIAYNDFKKQKLDGGSRYKVYDVELGKKLKHDKFWESDLGTSSSKGEEFDKNGSDNKFMKFVSINKKKQKSKDKKRTKTYECPYCHRVFKSGQALGGHKRSHFMGNSGKRNNIFTTVYEAETSEVKDLLDLNLPAPEEEEEESEHSQFVN